MRVKITPQLLKIHLSLLEKSSRVSEGDVLSGLWAGGVLSGLRAGDVLSGLRAGDVLTDLG